MKYSFNGFTDTANSALNEAISSAEGLGHTYIGSEHILLGLMKVEDGVAYSILSDYGVTAQSITELIEDTIGAGNRTALTPDAFTPRAKRVLETAVQGVKNMSAEKVGTEHILLGILGENDNYAIRFLNELGVDIKELALKTLDAAGVAQGDELSQKTYDKKAKKDNKTPTLSKYGRDLTEEAQNGRIDPVIGREEEILRVIQILCRRTKNNACLIGEPGVGKTAIAEGLALKIKSGEIPEILKHKRLISLDLTGMVAGTKYRGDFEERIKTIIDEISKCDDIILFIDEVHNIVGAGAAEGATDAANILKPALARGELQLIGATTLAEYRNIEKDAALERRFQPVTVNEPSEEDALLILKGIRDKYEAHHNVEITDDALRAAVELSARYITDRYLPDKAIDLIDEAGSRLRIKASETPDSIKEMEQELKGITAQKDAAISDQNFEEAAKLRDRERELTAEIKASREKEVKKSSGVVTKELVAEIVSGWTGVPVKELTTEESDRLLRMEEVLHSRIIGQNEAVSAVSKAIRRGRTGLRDPSRPIGSFIFLGPTGVGKTELTKALAEAMFGDEKALIRLDMSEYMEKHTVSRLVGSPPGYVGFDEGGQLTEKVRRQPYSVILFDEIEKAHPDIFNILLQILDDGILTDSKGRTVNFKNTIIIMTSNVGARLITDKKTSLGFGNGDSREKDFEEIKSMVTAELKKAFRPEFLNRLDDIIVFSKLNREDVGMIAEKLLLGLSKRMLALEITVAFDESVINAVADVGFDPIYGARPLKRAVRSNIEDMLSEKMLDGSLKKGDNITVFYKDGKYFVE